MWFSMWFLASIVTFGLAFFPLVYRSFERRNQHFRRQHDMEKQALRLLNAGEREQQMNEHVPLERSATLWTALIILVIPAFAAMYVLSRDLIRHENHQQAFLKEVLPENGYKPSVSL